MFMSLSEYIRKIGKLVAKDSKYHLKEIKIFFSAPNPEQATDSHNLTIKDEVANEANFQWVSFQVLFSTEEMKYYIYSIPLDTNGTGKPPDLVFESDDDWSGKNKDNPAKDLTPGDIKRAFPRVFKGPDLFPAKSLPFGVPTNYINTSSSDKGESYSSEEFEGNFKNDYYIVLNPKSKELKNPFGETVEPAGKTYPETTEKGSK